MNESAFLKSVKMIYEAFEDGLSKELYIDRLNWLITGDYHYVEQIVKKSHPEVPVWNCQEESEFLKESAGGSKHSFLWGRELCEKTAPVSG